jgi:PAS domain S-box-containing protein
MQEKDAQALEMLETLTKQMAVPVTRCSRDMRYLWANEVYANWIRRPLSEIVDRPISEVLGNNAFEALRAHFHRVLSGEKVHCEQEAVFLGIGLRWISADYTPTLDAQGNVDGWVAVLVDITERKRADEAIRESEMRYRTMVETANEGVWLLDSTLHNSYVNRQMAEMLGYEPGEMLGRSVFDFYFPEDVERKKQVLTRRQQGLREQIEDRLRRRDGSELWVRLAATPVFKGNGEFDGALAMVCDITERKRAEEAVRESEQRFGLLADNAPVLIWMSDTDKLCTYVNRRWLDFTGRSLHSQLRNGWAEAVHSEDLQHCMDTYTQAFDRREQLQMEYRVRRHDGEYRWIFDTGVPRYNHDGSFAGYIGIAVDVTERKTAEEALHHLNRTLEEQAALLQTRQEFLRNFVKNVPAGVAMLDRDMRYLQVSDRFCADYSIDSSQVLGRSHYELFPDIPDRWKELHHRALEGETLRAEEDRWDREGGTIWVRWEMRPWWNSNGSQGGVLLFAEDITRIKRSEETLSKVNQKLIQAHEEERTRIARELHDDICQRIALLAVRLDDFRHGHPESPSELRRELGQASEEVQDLGSDLQALSHRLHSSKLEYLGLAAAAAGFCKEYSAQQGVEIDFQSEGIPEQPSEEISICLFRVLQEAVQNAAKHSGSRHLQVSLKNGSREIELKVYDSGIGFELEKAFQKQGLGLTSMRERMKLVNGELSIESGLQRGTTVCARVSYNSQMKSAKAG